MQKLLLDTCAIIWLATGDRKLSAKAREMMRSADMLCFSSISIWEIASKVKKGELEIPVSPAVLADMLSRQYGMRVIPLDTSIMLKAAALPEIHKDPADRFIIATALLKDMPIVSGDHRFSEYGVETIR